jgi:micrococcal nuclease
MEPLAAARLALGAWLVLGGLQASARPLSGTVVAVHDGDTISVRTSDATIRVRLYGIDCPEYRQPFSARARQFTAKMVFKRAVTVLGQGTDQYDRLLGRVFADGVEVNEALVRNGLAWHYEIRVSDRALAEAERYARAARVGIWSQPNPVPPWKWRRGQAPVER